MAGLLDFFSNMDPVQSQSLLGAGMGMLNASGPSLMPHSLGQVAAAGYSGAQAAQQTALDRQKEQMQMAMLQQQVAQATRKNNMINDWMAGRLQGAEPSTTAPDGATPTGPAASSNGPSSGQAAPMGMNSGGTFGGVPNDAVMADFALNNGQHIGEWINDRSKPTDFARMLREANIDQNSPLGQQIMQQRIAKENNIPLVAGRAGAPMYDSTGQIVSMAPMIPKNAVPTIQNGRVVGVSPLAGANAVEEGNAYSERSGINRAEPIAGFDEAGNPIYGNKLDAARGRPTVPAAPGPMPGQPGFDITHMNPAQKKALFKQAEQVGKLRSDLPPGSQVIRPGLAPGIEKSIGGNVETMNSDFADLYTANKNAPYTLALLDNIKQLAPKAITGSSADKLAYVNGLLTIGGLKPAKDLASATDLLNKNANMLAINMRLGASGGGSDALQSLAQAANPNSHMQPDAIAKAADEVAGQVKMRQAQYSQLLPFKMKNDVQGYYGAQQQFASKSDPRTYQPDAQQHAAPAPAAAPQKFDMLPPAAQFDGKRMKADNGTIYRSQGGKWVKE